MIRKLSLLGLLALAVGCTSGDRAEAPTPERFDVVVTARTGVGEGDEILVTVAEHLVCMPGLEHHLGVIRGELECLLDQIQGIFRPAEHGRGTDLEALAGDGVGSPLSSACPCC